jgi:hypothetical protein
VEFVVDKVAPPRRCPRLHPPPPLRDSSVGIATRLLAGVSGVRMTAEARDLCLLQNVQICSGVQSASCSIDAGFL